MTCTKTLVFTVSEPLEHRHFSSFLRSFWDVFRVPVLGGLQHDILMMLAFFWGIFWRPFGALWGYLFAPILKEFQGPLKSQGWPKVESDLVGIWGPETGLHQHDKQIYRWKSADL